MTDFAGQLRHAFPVEPVPKVLFDNRYPCDPDRADAASLQGLKWTDLPAEFWRAHWGAELPLYPEAFVYYLPSMLECSATGSAASDPIEGSLIHMLDTSANPETIPQFTWERFALLSAGQFGCVEAWCEIVGSRGGFSDTLQRERVELTIMVLKEAAARRATLP